ncbi:MAG: cytochrome c biogenesis protein CcsA [Deltaproteobacteria bacterium]
MKQILSKIISFIFSIRAAGFYLAVFAIAIAVGTFIENDFGTSSAQALVYRAKWFEVLMLLFSGTIIANIVRYRLVQNRKWAALIFHVSIIIILIGAGVTRYIGYEGMMGIREGNSSNTIISSESYLNFQADFNGKSYSFDELVNFSSLGNNKFDEEYQIGPHIFRVKLDKFVPNPTEQLVQAEDGKPVVKLVVAGNFGREDHFVYSGDKKDINGTIFNFTDVDLPGAINFKFKDKALLIASDKPVSYTIMASQQSDTILPGEIKPLFVRSMYKIGDFSFVAADYLPNGKVSVVSGDRKMKSESTAGLNLSITKDNQSKQILILGNKSNIGKPEKIQLGDLGLTISYGSKIIELPFSIQLRDFQMERYPGTENASSYASEVTVIDPANSVNKDFRIYMNNILNYGGYRFFQSSFDKDELGTYLSVNHDFWGTLISYIGYFLLTLGMVMTLFSKNSRFTTLIRKMNRSNEESMKTLSVILIFFIFGSTGLSAAEPVSKFSKSQATELGKIMVQDFNGRFEPANTLANEVMRKLSKKEKLYGLTSDQIFWSMMQDPGVWQNVPVINIGKMPEIQNIVGTKEKLASFSQFFTPEGNYKLMDFVSQSQSANPRDQNMFDKAILKLDEKVNITSMILSQQFLRIFPVPDHPGDAWVSPADIKSMKTASPELIGMFGIFDEFMKSGNETTQNKFLQTIAAEQVKYSGKIIPSASKMKAELLLSKLDVFGNLMKIYGLLSLVVLGFFFYSVFRSKPTTKLAKWTWIVIVGFFVFHTFGIALRWYISGRAPWSNGYESMIYISWTSILAGLILSRKSLGGMAATLILTSTILSVAAMSWLDPEITPLVPVLRSYWLTIHVALIAGSYGFLLLGAVISILNLILMILSTEVNKKVMMKNIRELTMISEIILLVGLIMLSVGTYLGGVWANESWGRYWGWDAKETWALVTILVYAFILHMRMIPGLKSIFAYNFATLFGFASVIMTYFGVNYYLSGLHSYAAGDPVPIPPMVYYTVIILALISGLAYYFYNKRFNPNNS